MARRTAAWSRASMEPRPASCRAIIGQPGNFTGPVARNASGHPGSRAKIARSEATARADN
jgi:hypothetical protein